MIARRSGFLTLIAAAVCFLNPSTGLHAQCAPADRSGFDLAHFDEPTRMCRAAGRLQDRRYCQSRTMDRVLACGKDAIPILIRQLKDTRKTQEPIFDYWAYTTVGDVAEFILEDFFVEEDETTTTLPEVRPLYETMSKCELPAEDCWRKLIRKRGRAWVQREWQAIWNKYKVRLVWDDKGLCFRVLEVPQNPNPGKE